MCETTVHCLDIVQNNKRFTVQVLTIKLIYMYSCVDSPYVSSITKSEMKKPSQN